MLSAVFVSSGPILYIILYYTTLGPSALRCVRTVFTRLVYSRSFFTPFTPVVCSTTSERTRRAAGIYQPSPPRKQTPPSHPRYEWRSATTSPRCGVAYYDVRPTAADGPHPRNWFRWPRNRCECRRHATAWGLFCSTRNPPRTAGRRTVWLVNGHGRRRNLANAVPIEIASPILRIYCVPTTYYGRVNNYFSSDLLYFHTVFQNRSKVTACLREEQTKTAWRQ